jgi:phosphoserine phosphatase
MMSILTDRRLQHLLEKETPNSERPIAVFDCDDTLIRTDIGEAMFYFQLEHFLFRISPAILWPDHPKHQELSNLYEGLSALPPEKAIHDRRFTSFADMVLDWYFSQLAGKKTEKACSDIVRLFSGFTPDEVRQIARSTTKRELESPAEKQLIGTHLLPKGIRFIKETVALLNLLRAKGFDIWTVSGSNQWSVEAICERLNISIENVIGINLETKDGAFTPATIQPVPVLDGKVGALQTRTFSRPRIVISDSTYDIPLFNYATDLKVLVNVDNGRDFFITGNVHRDETWLVVENPTLLERLPD